MSATLADGVRHFMQGCGEPTGARDYFARIRAATA
jgi:hypothetical protein